MTIFDSCVWLAYLNHNDSQHQKAQKIFTSLSGPILLPEYVILEVYTVLLRRLNKKAADTFLRVTTDNQDTYVILSDETFFLDIVSLCQKQNHKGLSFVDTALLVLSKKYPVITFDRPLQKALSLKIV